MDDYIDVKIDVFEHTSQRARLRRSLTVTALIEEILREFDDITADSPEKYAIYLKGFDHPLKADQNLVQLDIQPQDELVFDYVRQTNRRMLDVQNYATLREETTGKEFDIQWQPAVIGRPSTDMDHNIMLAINVQLLPNGKTISRRHAQITFSDGRYFVEPLAEQNPVFINGREVTVFSKRELRNGDKLSLGTHRLTLIFAAQGTGRVARPATREPVSQSQSAPVAQTPAHRTASPYPGVEASKFSAQDLAPALVIEAASSPNRVGERIEMPAFPFLIGRGLEAFSTENEMSRRHAEITYDAQKGTYYLTDLKSTNGVSINGQRISANVPQPITPGMRLGFGSVLAVRFEV